MISCPNSDKIVRKLNIFGQLNGHFWDPVSYLVVLLLYWGPGEQLIPITANAILHVHGGDWQSAELAPG